jgi:hypothetical protein
MTWIPLFGRTCKSILENVLEQSAPAISGWFAPFHYGEVNRQIASILLALQPKQSVHGGVRLTPREKERTEWTQLYVPKSKTYAR